MVENLTFLSWNFYHPNRKCRSPKNRAILTFSVILATSTDNLPVVIGATTKYRQVIQAATQYVKGLSINTHIALVGFSRKPQAQSDK